MRDLKFLYIGHRGTRSYFDENTFSAFNAAKDAGANCIELDVRKTRDNRLIVFHDKTLNRVTTHSGSIKNLTYKELQEVETQKTHKKIPLLANVLKKFKNKIDFMIELKQKDIRTEIIDLIIRMELKDHCVISGREFNVLSDIKSNFPPISVCYNITKGDFTLKEFIERGKNKKLPFNPNMINLRSNLVKKEFIDTCEKNNILPLAWDFKKYSNPLDKIKELIRIGIRGILFDNHKNIPIIKKWRENQAYNS
jgi:glycerophosphoryl diester phosphodiesterase